MGVPINNVSRRVVYAASGTGPYAFTFEILAAADIAVYKDDTLLTLTTDYTVTINANGTGSITLTASPTGATQIAIVGNRTIQRLTDFVTGGDLFANTINDELDQQTIFAQQNAEGLDRSLKAPQTDPTSINMTLPRASVRANKTLAFDANGNPTTGEVIGDNRGNWAAGTAYNKRDIVKDTSNGNIYYANTAHTSSGSQPISSNADSAKWDLIVDNAAAGASASAAAASASAAASSASAASTSASNASSSASSAASSASAASTSASNASTSATNAASSASTASTQASNAATSATNAANSATSASNSASTATTQATNASNSASSASTSATNAANSASSASSSASSASSSASSASTSASNAASSATAAAASATSAAASYDSFDDRYLGAKTSDPTLDNDGNALLTGALYFNSSTGEMKVYSGSAWVSSFLTAGAQTIAGVKTFSSNPILDAGTANGVAYLNGSKVLTTGSALTFDGTNLGVGTASPTQPVSIRSAGAAYLDVAGGSRTLGTNSFTFGQAADGVVAFFQRENAAMYWAVNSTEAMRLTSTGLGIGTSSPAQKLEVSGGAAQFNGGGIDGTFGDAILFGNTTFSTVQKNRIRSSISAGAALNLLSIETGTGTTGAYNANQLVLVGDGNVGIGTSSPGTKLHVQVSALSGYPGVANAGALIERGNGPAALNIASPNTENGIIWFADQDSASVGNIRYEHSSNTLSLRTNGSDRFYLDSSGNLGLGVTPSAWYTGFKSFQAGATTALADFSSGTYLFNNWYIAASGANTYLTSNFASSYSQVSGEHRFYNAPSGTAGNTISFTQAMTLDANGRLLVGSTSTFGAVSGEISVKATSGGAGVGIWDSSVGAKYQLIAGAQGSNAFGLYDLSTSTYRWVVDASGNLGVGTTSPLARLDVVSASQNLSRVRSSGANEAVFLFQNSNTGTNAGDGFYVGIVAAMDAYLWNYENNPIIFGTNNTERARITSGGYFKASFDGTYNDATGQFHEFVGNVANGYTVRTKCANASPANHYIGEFVFSAASPNNTGAFFIECRDSTAARFELRSNGGLANYSANDVNLSDRREKTNFAPATSYLDKICSIPVQTFNYIDQSEDDPGLTLGVVAQDVQAVAPELVMESNWGTKDDPKMRLSIYQTDLQYALMKCIQELKAQNDDLRARVAQLEAK